MSAGLPNIGWYTMTNAVIKIVYSTLYSKRIYLTRSLSIAATKTVDCSFIKAKHSTQVSSKNINSIEKILVVLPNNSPYHPYWKVRMLRRIYSAYNLVDYAKIGVILPVYLAISNWRGVNRSSQK